MKPIHCILLPVLFAAAGCASSPDAAATAKVDAAMNAAFAEFDLEYMNVAFEQHGHTRYAFHRTCAFFTKSGHPGFSQYFGDINSMRAVGHAGATGCYLLLDPEYDTVQVILTNSSANKIQRSDGNFARLNSVMLANLAESDKE